VARRNGNGPADGERRFVAVDGDLLARRGRPDNGHAPVMGNGHPLGNGHSPAHGNGHRARLGVVDYTLAKRSLLRDVRRGLLAMTDLCDAHPELLRAARHIGELASRQCPVCDRDDLRLLAYVYADELKRDNGRVWAIDKALALTASCRNGTCYIVEVCTGCSWNHLAEALVGRTAG
jgi:Family of unknown function (DUF5318)